MIKVDIPEEEVLTSISLSLKIHERQGVANIEMIAKIAGTTTAKQHVVKKDCLVICSSHTFVRHVCLIK